MNTLIGIQGGPGSFHEQAAAQLYKPLPELVYLRTFTDVFDKLLTKRIGSAVTAIANNRYGALAEPMNALLSGQFAVTGETYVRVEHQLLGLSGTVLADVKEVHSQAPALGQCQEFLHGPDLSPDVSRVEQEDTAESARMVAAWNDPTKVAIASRRAGELHGLNIVCANIQDDPDNITRFLTLERRNGQRIDESQDKSTILLTTAQPPGSLVDALTPLKDAAINIENLHSSYIPNSRFEMRFFIEINAGLADPRITKVFKQMVALGCQVEPIGSYKKADIPLSETES